MRKGLNNEETQGICEAVSFGVTAECDTGFDELPQIWDFLRENDMMDARYVISITDRFCDMIGRWRKELTPYMVSCILYIGGIANVEMG